MFEQEISRLPLLIQSCVRKLSDRLIDACEDDPAIKRVLAGFSESLKKEFIGVLVGSDFCAEHFIRGPALLVELIESDDLWRVYSDDEYIEILENSASENLPEQEFDRALRLVRRREIIRMIWRNLSGRSTLSELTGDMSRFADAVIQHALEYYYQHFCVTFGTPLSAAGEQQHMVVVGMGKLGAFELNLSSDIDLMYCFPESGKTQGARRELDNQAFFIRLGQRLIKSLSDVTAEGFVFRVDMRLRPFGQSGALAWSFDGMEAYYENQGREWERYALIKARVVAGDKTRGEQLMNRLRPFVFRRYVDFGVIESLREMKALINREVRRKGVEDNVKTGSGGIREIEFIAQVFQLMRGGREPKLQDRRLEKVLEHLDQMALLPPNGAKELQQAYVFLRDVEHRLQALEDRQTQTLPKDELRQARLAYSMYFDDWNFFDAQLNIHRNHVRNHFEAIITPREKSSGSSDHLISQAPYDEKRGVWKAIWLDEIDQETLATSLENSGFEQVDEMRQLISNLRQSRAVKGMQEVSRQRLDKLMPSLLLQLSQASNSLRTLERILPLVESIVRRSAYIALLIENPDALQRVIQLCAASPWVAEQLASHPILLDELLDAHALYQPLKRDQLADELQQCLLRIASDDLEQQMDALRHFKRAHVLRVAAAEIVGHLPLMKVSDYLTWIAEAILDCVFQLAWQQMTERYGRPMKDKETPCNPDFVILAYGKMGGIELGYGSDLDLVFLHDAVSNLMTDGERSIDNIVFFTRLGQRIIHLLTTHTPAGKLYEVDMRLRPSGSSGLLVSSLSAFEKYQMQQAWTWEHQALVRARYVAGCKRLQDRFESVRKNILCQARDELELKHEVVKMRNKMRDHLSNHDSSLIFDLKQDVGGIVDIEFIVQYAVLRWANQHQNLVTYTDNVRILEGLSSLELLAQADAHQLTKAYIAYRAATHRLVLQNQKAQLALKELQDSPFCKHREDVRRVWDSLLTD